MTSTAALASLALIVYALSYLAICAAFPFRNCRRCQGSGKQHNRLLGGGYRLCYRCAGTGRRVRIGRRLFEYVRTEYRTGTKPLPGDPRRR